MNIPLTKEQYRKLLVLVNLGHWMITAHKEDAHTEFDDAVHYFYSFAEPFGIKDLIEMTPDDQKHWPTRKFDELVEPYIDEYDNETFWDEIIERLSERDFEARYGQKIIEKMSFEERWSKRSEFESRYQDEFVEHGLDRITIKEK